MSHRKLFRLDQKKKIGHQALTISTLTRILMYGMKKNKLQSSTKNSSLLPQIPKGNSIMNTNQVQVMLKLSYKECLGHHISRITMGTNFAHNNITTSNDITHKMIPHINVLCPLMKHMIFCEENKILTTTKNCGNLHVVTKFIK